MDGQISPPRIDFGRPPRRPCWPTTNPTPYTISRTELRFQLAPNATRVIAKLHMSARGTAQDMVLDGEGLKLRRIEIDGVALSDHRLTDTTLTIPASAIPSGEFMLETEVEISPAENTALEGSICRTACIVLNARPRASARLPSTPTARCDDAV